MLYDFVVRKEDGQITGLNRTDRVSYVGFEDNLSIAQPYWIIRKDMTKNDAADIENNHYKVDVAIGVVPFGHIALPEYGIAADASCVWSGIALTETDEVTWMDREV